MLIRLGLKAALIPSNWIPTRLWSTTCFRTASGTGIDTVILPRIREAGYPAATPYFASIPSPSALCPKGVVLFESPGGRQLQQDWVESRLTISDKRKGPVKSPNDHEVAVPEDDKGISDLEPDALWKRYNGQQDLKAVPQSQWMAAVHAGRTVLGY